MPKSFDSFTGVVSAASSRKQQQCFGRDGRKIYQPAEIPAAFQTGLRRFEAERPGTIEAQRRWEQSGNGFVAESSSYFPKIRESQTARDSREQKSKFVSSTVFMGTAVTKQRLLPRHSLSRPGKETAVAGSFVQSLPKDRQVPPSVVANLDQSGMAVLHQAFEKYEQLNEDEFITEMLVGLKADKLPRMEQVDLTCEISTIFRKADVRSEGLLDWVAFSTFITQTLGDGDNMASKIYFAEIDKILFHDNKRPGFSILDPTTSSVVREATRSTSSQVLDAIYSPFGRYVVTATTSPVISLYDIDSLKIRQQIPTQTAQLALANHSNTTSTQLYTSCTNGQVHAWGLETLCRSHTFFDKGHPVMNDLLVIDGMSQVAGACLDGKIYMIDLHLHRVTKALSGHKKAVTMLRFSSENGYLVSAGLDHCIQVWNPHVEQKIGSLTGHRSQLIGMEVVSDMPHIITADECGVVKIWDLRKFAAVQTIAKELYVKDHSIPRTLSRPMSSLCYISSKKRIAIAHSTIFFIGQAPTKESKDTHESTPRADRQEIDEEHEQLDEAKKPISVFYCPQTQYFLTLTCWEIKSWDANSGQLVRTTSPTIGSEMTCACLVDDCFSCFVGTECGIVARLMIPNGSVIIQKRVHSAEITAIQWLKEKRQVVSGATNGNILITRYDTLDVLFKLNHWRGVQSTSNAFFYELSSGELSPAYSVPLSLRAFFYGNEIERLIRIFGQEDASRCGSIPLSKLPSVLEAAFPISFMNHHTVDGSRTTESETSRLQGTKDRETPQETITFASLLEILKESLTALQDGKIAQSKRSISSVSALDVHSQLFSLVTGSSADGTFCAWSTRNGAVVAQGSVGSRSSRQAPPPSISQISFLHPYPYFVCTEVGSCELEFWSTVAIPPLLPHSYQRFLKFAHRLRIQTYAGLQKKDDQQYSSFFLTETEASSPDHLEKGDHAVLKQAEEIKETNVLAAKWFYGGTQEEKLVCVGDEQGYITIYDFETMLKRMDALKEGSCEAASKIYEGSSSANDGWNGALFPTECLPKLNQWHAHQLTAIQSLEIFRISELQSSSNLIVASLTEDGCVSLWSIGGELVGRLNERPPVARNRLVPRVPTPWKLRIDALRAKSNDVDHAERVLQRVEHKVRRAQEDQTAVKRVVEEQRARRNTVGGVPVKQSPRVASRLLSVSSIRSSMPKF